MYVLFPGIILKIEIERIMEVDFQYNNFKCSTFWFFSHIIITFLTRE